VIVGTVRDEFAVDLVEVRSVEGANRALAGNAAAERATMVQAKTTLK
jgi:hypothetical protein